MEEIAVDYFGQWAQKWQEQTAQLKRELELRESQIASYQQQIASLPKLMEEIRSLQNQVR
jgi:SMC interacting uncharacterized protein involved in chromosome segregation